jgi:hypothetical protein
VQLGCRAEKAQAATVSFPRTPVGTQASWLLGAVKHSPIPDSEVTAHFDQAFLSQVTPAKLNSVFTGVGSLRLDSITRSTGIALVFVITANGQNKLRVSMAVDPRGLIDDLLLQPANAATPPPAPSSWGGVQHYIRSVAPQARFLVASLNGGACRPIQSLDAGTSAPHGPRHVTSTATFSHRSLRWPDSRSWHRWPTSSS